MTDQPMPPPLPGEPLPAPPPPGAPTHPSATFQDPSPVGKITVLLLFINVVMAFVLAASLMSELRLIDRARNGNISFEEAGSNDNRQRALFGASTLVFVATGVMWLVFVHRAHTNLDAFGVRDLRFTHGWAVGGFLVPILNLVRPPQIMSELLRASDREGGTTEWKMLPTPGIITGWWATYLLGIWVREITVLTLRGDGATIDNLRLSDQIIIGTQLLIAIAGVLGVIIIRGVMASQRERAMVQDQSGPAAPGLA